MTRVVDDAQVAAEALAAAQRIAAGAPLVARAGTRNSCAGWAPAPP